MNKTGIVFILSLFMLVILTTYSYAESFAYGKAYIPFNSIAYYSSSNEVYTQIQFSNISDDIISVKITLYKQNGTVYKDTNGSISSGYITGDSSTMSNYNDNISSENTTTVFSLNAHSSGYINIRNDPSSTYGYGVIEWNQDNSTVRFGMIAQSCVNQAYNGTTIKYPVAINSGLPF